MSAIADPSPSRRRFHLLRLPAAPAYLSAAGVLALVLSFVLVHRGVLAGLLLVFLPPILWLVTRSYGGLALGIALILVLPYWSSLGTSQTSVLRVASLAAAIPLLMTRRLRPGLIDLALVSYVAIVILGWVLQYDQPHAGRVLFISLTPIGFYLGARSVPRARIEPLMLVALIAGACGALTVIYEFARGHAIFVDPNQYLWNSTSSSIFRPGGIFGSPPDAADVMCGVGLFGLACISRYRGKVRRLAWFCLGLCCIALVLTFTRADLIAAGVGILAFLWMIRSSLLRPLRVAWFLVAVGLVYVVVIPAVQQTSTFQQGIVRPGNLTVRESYWSVALPVITSSAHNFIFGVGTGALEAPSLGNNLVVPSDLATAPQTIDNSLHSQYITTLMEQGAVGLGALVLLLLAVMVPAVRAGRRRRDPVLAALAAAVLAVTIVMSVDTALLLGPTTAVLMVACGFAANVLRDPTGNAAPSALAEGTAAVGMTDGEQRDPAGIRALPAGSTDIRGR